MACTVPLRHAQIPVPYRHLQQEVEAAQRQAAAASAAAKTLQAQVAALDARLESRPAPAAVDASSPVLAALRATVQQLEQQLQAAHKAASGRCGTGRLGTRELCCLASPGGKLASSSKAGRGRSRPPAGLLPPRPLALMQQAAESELHGAGATSCWRRSCAAARRRTGACSRPTGPWPSWHPRSRRCRAPGQPLRGLAAPSSWPRS